MSSCEFIKPQLAFRESAEMAKFLDDAGFIADEKIDGARIQTHIVGGRTAAVYSRTGKLVQENGVAWLWDVAWPIERAILDGEFYPIEPDGRPAKAGEAVGKAYCLAVFDCLGVEEPLLQRPFLERRTIAEGIVERLADPRIRMTRLSEDRRGLLAQIEAEGGEGIIVKHRASPYAPGSRISTWMKVISHYRLHEYDVVVCGLTEKAANGKPFKTGECALEYGVFDPRLGKVRRCGSLGVTGSREEMAQHIGKVAVVRAWWRYPSGCLRHPQHQRFRDDKPIDEVL